jgi:hypothetical protein
MPAMSAYLQCMLFFFRRLSWLLRRGLWMRVAAVQQGSSYKSPSFIIAFPKRKRERELHRGYSRRNH